ncbi:MAG: GNAT family N-acetyltransferase [Candidatus Promineifilaceae bacterium]|jgi:RimJ/RimL family protein N-acetyltransferase
MRENRYHDVYRGELVRLTAVDPQKDAPLFAAWQRDAEYARLLDSDPVRLWSAGQNQEWLEKQQKDDGFDGIQFMMRTLEDDKAIGFVELGGISWHNGSGWVGIGIGDRAYRDKGCGSDAMRILARYAFEELGLHRLNLNVFSYNTRAIHVYEKIGFQVEGRIPEALHREGKRWDLIFMGLLREEFFDNLTA